MLRPQPHRQPTERPERRRNTPTRPQQRNAVQRPTERRTAYTNPTAPTQQGKRKPRRGVIPPGRCACIIWIRSQCIEYHQRVLQPLLMR